ncbi:TPA: hypothetical protein ACHR8U_002953 [Listeria monocytogenes]
MKPFRSYANNLIKNRDSEDFPEINKFIPLKYYKETGLRLLCQVTSEKTIEGEELYNDVFMGFWVLLPAFSGSIAYEFENEHIAEYGDKFLEKLSGYPCADGREEVKEQEEVLEFINLGDFSSRDMAYQYASTYYRSLAINPVKTVEKFIEDFIKNEVEAE